MTKVPINTFTVLPPGVQRNTCDHGLLRRHHSVLRPVQPGHAEVSGRIIRPASVHLPGPPPAAWLLPVRGPPLRASEAGGCLPAASRLHGPAAQRLPRTAWTRGTAPAASPWTLRDSSVSYSNASGRPPRRLYKLSKYTEPPYSANLVDRLLLPPWALRDATAPKRLSSGSWSSRLQLLRERKRLRPHRGCDALSLVRLTLVSGRPRQGDQPSSALH